ncbi:MAG: hypothetical protein ACRD4P_01940 [Bryobacteraceae bacterium]
MRRITWVLALGLATAFLLPAQRDRPPDRPHYEVKSVFPRETSPGQFQQVDQREIETLADQGWELVSVIPYIYRNEERGNDVTKIKPMVTISYPAYFFKRARTVAGR